MSSGQGTAQPSDVKPFDALQLQVTTPAPRRQWLSLLDRDTNASIYQTPQWLDAICRAEGYEDASRLYETAAGRQFVLPIVRRRRYRTFSVEESMPSAWGMGGLIAAQPIDADDLGLIWSERQLNTRTRLRVRDGNLGRGVPTASHHQDKVTVTWETKHVLDLREGFDAVYSKSFHRSAKKGIRKAERAGVEVECDSSGRLVPVYYDLYTRWVKRSAAERNLPTSLMLHRARSREPLRKFHLIAELLGPSSKIWVAWYRGEPIAAMMSLSYKSRAFAFRGQGDKELANALHANDLLNCYRIEDACRAGCTSYNMGGSGGIPSLMAYKAKFGAVALEFPVYTIESFPWRQITRSVESVNSTTRALAGRWRQQSATKSDD